MIRINSSNLIDDFHFINAVKTFLNRIDIKVRHRQADRFKEHIQFFLISVRDNLSIFFFPQCKTLERRIN